MEDEILFEVISKLNKHVRVTKSYWQKIVTMKHPSMKNRENSVIETLESPSEIRQSKFDSSVYLYYRSVGKYFNAVVVKHLNGDGFIITTYFTDRIKEGKEIWKK